MKKFCEDNKFIFLIFDAKNSEFFRYNKKNELKITNLKTCKFKYDVKNIFTQDDYINRVKKLNFFFSIK